jgi:hypothetical protein
MENGKACNCTHHKVVPVCIALIGLVILLGGINVLTAGFVNIVWPVLLIVIGGAKLMGSGCKCC